MRRFKIVLSSLAAKILIVPVTLIYVVTAMGASASYSDVETNIHMVHYTARWVSDWLTLFQLLIIGAPYLLDRPWVPRICMSVIYSFGAVVPTLTMYFYIADGVYEHTIHPFVQEPFVLLGVVVTLLYLIALMTPVQAASSASIAMDA